ncbi:hypothetical protein BMR10_15150 [Methylococcaceae bacterium CS4]|nr:hypothetical protein BMR10_15150 [Methylococcaceae bacterium CS4]
MTNNVNSEKITFEDRDEYKRKPIAEKVISLLKDNSIPVSPMIIDGEWGTGKTEFCHKLINLITKENPEPFRTIYINAFQADHADEPLMTLLASILNLIKNDMPKYDLFRKKVLPTIQFLLKTVAKASISWTLRLDSKEINQIGNELINHTFDGLLKEHEDANKNIQTLQIALKELTKNNSIVIFVDELDRCRPDFAIAILETIKHIFAVKGLQFVLITNSKQLRSSINHCYGVSVDAKKYLDKFIGFSFTLPVTVKISHEYHHLSTEHFISLINSHFPALLQMPIESFWIELFKNNQLSLREVETFTKNLQIYSRLANEKFDLLGRDDINGLYMLKIFGVFIFSFFPEIQTKLSIDPIVPSEITPALRQKIIPNIESEIPVSPDKYVQITYVMFWIDDKIIDSKYNPWKKPEGLFKVPSQGWEHSINGLFPGALKEGGINAEITTIKEVIQTLMLMDNNKAS